VARHRDPEHLLLHSPIEALGKTIGLRRVGLGDPVLYLQSAAGRLEAVGCKARAAVGQDVHDFEREGGDHLFEEGNPACRCLVIL
jgi:hypothetical protein